MRLTFFFILLVTRSFTQELNAQQLDSVKACFQKLEAVPSSLAIPVFTALAHYPELTDNTIRFKAAKIKTTLNARPTLASLLFCPKEKRNYVVRINSTVEDSVISIYELSIQAQTGILGHEFAHFYDYRSRSFFGVIARGFSYISATKKAAFEKEIDLSTIQHGLGAALYAWSYYVLYQSNATVDYKNFKRFTYLTPEQILLIMQQATSTTPE